MNERILVVDDDPTVREVARGALEREGYVVYEAVEGGAGLDLASARAPALVVLDRMLPDVSGEVVLRELRRRSQVPILVLSAKGELDDRVEGLGLGADDYLPKPFSPRELVARTKALLRRAGGSAAERDLLVFDGGRLAIDTVRHEVRVDGRARELTRTEFDLLLVLAQYPGRAYARSEIAYRLRGHDFDGDERVVDVHVRNLRRKVEVDAGDPRCVETVRGIGYRLGLEPA
jgi:DNA-binding response OmpR family regulator